MDKHKINEQMTCDEADNYIQTLTNTIDKTVKEKVKTITITPEKIGLPEHVIKLIQEKHKLRKLYKRTGNKLYKTQYNTLNREIKEHVKTEHKINWENKCDDLELDINQNKTWNNIKQMMGLKKKNTQMPTLITMKDNKKHKSITTEEKIKTMTETLENIFSKDDIKPYFDEEHKTEVETEINTEYKERLKPQTIPRGIDSTKTEHSITIQEIENKIDRLNTKKAPGEDKIGNKLIKLLKPSLTTILHKYFNITLHKGYHTKKWKQTLAKLLDKPPKPPSNPLNYRTISLINNLSKIMESILTSRITKWSNTHNKINKEQAGFRAQHSTYDKIYELTQVAMHARNMKRCSAAIFMDVEKAFDKVWHAGLIHTLIHLELAPIYIRYIYSFLQDRYIYFYINGIKSPNIYQLFGIPQGSPLSAILFILYVAGMPTPTSPETLLAQFADDIKIYSMSKHFTTTQRRLQKSMDEIIAFCGKRRISISKDKTFELMFKGPRHAPEKLTKERIKMDNTNIKTQQTGKFLGVHFDNDLSFKKHINMKHGLAQTRLIQLSTIHSQKYGPSNRTMIRLYKSLVRSILEYGHISLITVNPIHIKKWETLQTKFIRRTFQSPKTSNKHTLKLANLPTIKNRLKHLAQTWYNNAIENNKEVHEFTNTQVRKNSKMKTPYSILNGIYKT